MTRFNLDFRIMRRRPEDVAPPHPGGRAMITVANAPVSYGVFDLARPYEQELNFVKKGKNKHKSVRLL